MEILNILYQMTAKLKPFCIQITMEAMKSDVDEIALQGIEFWSTVCDEEVDLAIELSEVIRFNILLFSSNDVHTGLLVHVTNLVIFMSPFFPTGC